MMRRVAVVALLLAGCGTSGGLKLSFPAAEAQTTAGATLTIPLTVRFDGGTPAEVALSAAVDPAGAALEPQLLPEKVPPGGVARLKVAVGPEARPGRYRVTVTGKGGEATASASIIVQVARR